MKKKNNFGTLVKYVRKSRKLTMKQLAELSGISERQILRIEQSEVVEGTLSTVYALSKVLNINLIEYSTIFTEFKTLDEYETYTKIRYLIETRRYDELELALQDFNLDELANHEFSVLTQVIYYAHALITILKYQNQPRGINLCFTALNTTHENFNFINLKKYIRTDLSYAILSQIEASYFFLGNKEDSLKISTKLVSLIEETYYDTNLPVVNVSTIVFRTYITMLNNQADHLFLNGDYKNSILLCEKAVDKLVATNSIYLKHYLLFLLFENYYKLGELEKANEYFSMAIGVCLSENNFDYFEQEIKPKLKTHYPLLTYPNILNYLS